MLVESEIAVPDQSVLFDEVVGGSLQCAFALCFLFCRARALVEMRRVLSMIVPSTPSYAFMVI